MEQKIKELTEKLNYYNLMYYQKHTSVVSDFEFDKMLEELQSLEIKYPQFKQPDSPTQRVGGTISKDFPTVKHKYQMLSLGNTYSEEDLIDFDKRVKKGLIEADFSFADVEYVCELKFDGVSISLIYENGLLVRGVTRGDGVQGDEVTNNVKTIKTIPMRIDATRLGTEFEVRGEIFMPKKVFEEINQEREEIGLEKYANPRNTASGTMKLQESSEVAKRKLDAFIYFYYADNIPFKMHSEAVESLENVGFPVSNTYKKCKNVEEVLAFIKYWDKERENLPVETDGVVIKVNRYDYQNALGFTSKSPRWAIAYKYKAESISTQLKSVSYQVGRTGAITPVAELTPIFLAGTTVKRASLHNANEIERLGLCKDDYVFVEKGGEIIPKVTGVDMTRRGLNATPIDYINNCPECNTILVRNEGEANHFCPNSKGCPPQIKGKLEHFIHRKAMNMDSLGEGKIELLFEKGLLRNIDDFYTLTYKSLFGLEKIIVDEQTGKSKKIGFKEKTVENILAALEKSKEIPFEKVLFGLGIRFVGETGARKLVEHFENIDNLAKATLEELSNVRDVGERTAQSVVDFFKDDENLQLIKNLKNYGLQFSQTNENKIIVSDDKLAGKTFLFSGTFSQSREDLQNKVLQFGGKLGTTVSKNLDFLVAGENMGPSKLEKAEKFKITMITEKDFLEMIGENTTININTNVISDKNKSNSSQKGLF
ncbi:MAG: NAD-dependent DNA ligase LigA [Bacteroidetes bacterium]|nr:MAG: NAD-dependent DNA ligase LigA [Bacteroidota bacterium]TAG90639.1 MAG: NAD-dependent DNA ligase LigA [Bacteroidota bacterium]